MSTKSREVIWGGQVRAAKMNAESARQRAKEAAREADRAEAYAWSLRMEGFGGPAQPTPTIGQCLNGGCGWMEAELPFAKQAPASRSMPSAVRAIRRSGNSKVRSDACGTFRYKPPVHLIKLTQEREVTPYVWVHPDDER